MLEPFHSAEFCPLPDCDESFGHSYSSRKQPEFHNIDQYWKSATQAWRLAHMLYVGPETVRILCDLRFQVTLHS